MNNIHKLIFLASPTLIKALEIICIYENDESYGLGCIVQTINILSQEDCYVDKINSIKSQRQTFNDVKFINFKSNDLKFIPKGISKIFKNIIAVIINSPKLRSITAEDLKPFGQKLQSLIISRSFIVSIDQNLFESTPNVSHLRIESEVMENIHENVFKPIRNSLRSLTINFKCVGFRKEDVREEIFELIELMKVSCFHPKYKAANFERTCTSYVTETEENTQWIVFCVIGAFAVAIVSALIILIYCKTRSQRPRQQIIGTEMLPMRSAS